MTQLVFMVAGGFLLLLQSPIGFSTSHAKDDATRVLAYTGYATSTRVFVTGRVIRDPPPPFNMGLLETIARNVDVLESDEVPGAFVDVKIGSTTHRTTTDADGLFAVELELSPPLTSRVTADWSATLDDGGVGAGHAIVVDDAPGVAVISDFDDTVVNSFVRDKVRLIVGTLTRGPNEIEVVDGAADAYQRAAASGARAFFYVSGSPLALYERIDAVLTSHAFPRGPILLKNLGNDGLFAQEDYKARRIEEIFKRLPNLQFILVGDSGEKDPEIYASLRARFPDRVAAILIRRAPSVAHEPGRFTEMFVVDDHAARPDFLAALVSGAERARVRKLRDQKRETEENVDVGGR